MAGRGGDARGRGSGDPQGVPADGRVSLGRQPGHRREAPGPPLPAGGAIPGGSAEPAVLVVEDDPEMAQLLEQALIDAGHGVEVVGDGVAAVEAALGRPFAAVVLDRLLPGLDGAEVCRRIRAQERRVPVLMLTALGGVEDRVEGLDAGADDYLVKPFSLAEFLARMRALVRRGDQLRPAPLRVGELRFDPLQRRAWRGEAAIELSPREADLLELFLSGPGVVLSRQTIRAQVWGGEGGGASNLVDQQIRHLREKIDRPFGRADLETVHRLGYRLRTPAGR